MDSDRTADGTDPSQETGGCRNRQGADDEELQACRVAAISKAGERGFRRRHCDRLGTVDAVPTFLESFSLHPDSTASVRVVGASRAGHGGASR